MAQGREKMNMGTYSIKNYPEVIKGEHLDDDVQKCNIKLRSIPPHRTCTSVLSTVAISLMLTAQTPSTYVIDPFPEFNVIEEWQLLRQRPAKTPLGERLMRIRERIIKSGVPLLDWDGIEHEVVERRGEKA
ncbi:MAG: hypothetical protein UZ01_00265 [Candidatus Brocadia sinica]|nr:MAG: hypothetical protein UZ01_00265 [Candidatus Brocadia sinica]